MINIRLEYNKSQLKIIDCPKFIEVPDVTFEVTSDTNDNIFIILKLNETNSKTIQLIKYNSIFKGKITFNNTDILNVKTASIQVCDCNGIKPYYSNTIPISIDVSKVDLDIKADTNIEIKKLKCEIIELKNIINNILSGNISNNINCNFKYSKPGMIPVTIDCNGTFILKRPFVGMVEEVNGIHAEDNKVVITSDNIKHINDKTIAEVLEIQSKTLNTMYELIKKMQDSHKMLRDDYIKLQLDFNAHKSNPII